MSAYIFKLNFDNLVSSIVTSLRPHSPSIKEHETQDGDSRPKWIHQQTLLKGNVSQISISSIINPIREDHGETPASLKITELQIL